MTGDASVPPGEQVDPVPVSERAALLEHFIDSLTDYGIFALDVDGHVATWNPGAHRIKGYEAGEIIGRHFSVFYPEEDLRAGKPEMELEVATAEGRFEDRGWRLRKDGSRFWANVVITAIRDDDGRLLGFGKVTRDLTDQRRHEEALRESEERFRLLVSNVADYAIYLLTPDGHVASWNLGAERLKGYSADEIVGSHFSAFYTDDDRRSGLPDHGLRTAIEEGRWEQEGWRLRRDGSRFWANVVLTALRGDDGALRGFAKVTRDLTDRKHNEDALREIAQRERENAASLRLLDEMKTDLVGIIAHDLRSPVDMVQHLLEMANDDVTDETTRGELLHRASERTARLGVLVDDILDLARIESGRMGVTTSAIDLRRIATEVVADVAEASGRSIELHVGPDVTALGDEVRAAQALSNLLSNAVKYSPVGEPVSVSVERRGREVVVSVRDHGPGIADDQRSRLFQRFSRLSTASGVAGSGMGLFIVRSFAEAQGGRAGIEPATGDGATFYFALPAEDAT